MTIKRGRHVTTIKRLKGELAARDAQIEALKQTVAANENQIADFARRIVEAKLHLTMVNSFLTKWPLKSGDVDGRPKG